MIKVSDDTLSMHSLLQKVVEEGLRFDLSWVELSVVLVSLSTNFSQHQSWEQIHAIYSAQAMLRQLPSFFEDIEPLDAGCHMLGLIAGLKQKILGIEHPDVLRAINDLAQRLVVLREFDAALKYYSKVKEIQYKKQEIISGITASAIIGVASIHSGQGKNLDAIEYYLEAYDIQVQLLIDDMHSIIPTELNDIDEVSQKLKNDEKYKHEFLNAVTELEREVYGYIDTCANLALQYEIIDENRKGIAFITSPEVQSVVKLCLDKGIDAPVNMIYCVGALLYSGINKRKHIEFAKYFVKTSEWRLNNLYERFELGIYTDGLKFANLRDEILDELSMSYHYLGHKYFESEKYRSALRDFRKMYTTFQEEGWKYSCYNEAEVLRYIACSCCRMHNINEALKYTKQAYIIDDSVDGLGTNDDLSKTSFNDCISILISVLEVV